MSTVDAQPRIRPATALWLHTKGAPEEVLRRCAYVIGDDGDDRPLDEAYRTRFEAAVRAEAEQGRRVLAVARRRLDRHAGGPGRRRA